jgi:hypothetical protein
LRNRIYCCFIYYARNYLTAQMFAKIKCIISIILREWFINQTYLCAWLYKYNRAGIRPTAVLREWFIDQANLCRNIYKHNKTYIHPTTPIRFDLAPYFSLAKPPRIPRIEYQTYLYTYTTYLLLKILSVASFR